MGVNWATYNVPQKARTQLAHLLQSINRSSILKRKTRLRCVNPDHGVRDVREVYGSRTVLLACGCKRPVSTLGAAHLLSAEIDKLEHEIEREEKQREETLV